MTTTNTPALPSASTEPHSATWLAERFEAFKSCSHRDADGTPLHLLAATMLREMDAEIQALRADARRFQWLLDNANIDHDPSEPYQLVIWEPGTGQDWKAIVRAAIDAAVSASGEGGQS